MALTLVGRYLWSHFYKDQPYRLSAALSTLQSIEELLRLMQPVLASSTAKPAEVSSLLSLQTVINMSDRHVAKQAQEDYGEAHRQGQESLAILHEQGHEKAQEVADWLVERPIGENGEKKQ